MRYPPITSENAFAKLIQHMIHGDIATFNIDVKSLTTVKFAPKWGGPEYSYAANTIEEALNIALGAIEAKAWPK